MDELLIHRNRCSLSLVLQKCFSSFLSRSHSILQIEAHRLGTRDDISQCSSIFDLRKCEMQTIESIIPIATRRTILAYDVRTKILSVSAGNCVHKNMDIYIQNYQSLRLSINNRFSPYVVYFDFNVREIRSYLDSCLFMFLIFVQYLEPTRCSRDITWKWIWKFRILILVFGSLLDLRPS